MAYYTDIYLANVRICLQRAIVKRSYRKLQQASLGYGYNSDDCCGCEGDDNVYQAWMSILQSWNNAAPDTNFISETQFKMIVGNINTTLNCVQPTSILAAPEITTQPVPRTITEGTPLTLTVVAKGAPTLTYRWQKDGVDIVGANAATYTKSNPVPGDSGTYTVIVTNLQGTVISTNTAVAVNAATVGAPVITVQPTGLTMNEGTTLNLSVTASGTGLSYQWKKDGTDISGAIAATYSKTNAVAGDSGSYTVVVTNSAGSVTSSAAVVTVNVVTISTHTVQHGATDLVVSTGNVASISLDQSITGVANGAASFSATISVFQRNYIFKEPASEPVKTHFVNNFNNETIPGYTFTNSVVVGSDRYYFTPQPMDFDGSAATTLSTT